MDGRHGTNLLFGLSPKVNIHKFDNVLVIGCLIPGHWGRKNNELLILSTK
jgi:hypothetical protein